MLYVTLTRALGVQMIFLFDQDRVRCIHHKKTLSLQKYSIKKKGHEVEEERNTEQFYVCCFSEIVYAYFVQGQRQLTISFLEVFISLLGQTAPVCHLH